MARGVAGAGEARDLVPVVARTTEHRDGALGHVGFVIVGNGNETVGGAPGVERGAGFVGERVRRDVRGGEGDRGVEVRIPLGERFARDGVDEVQAHVVDAGGAGGLDRHHGVGGGVVAAEGAEVVRRERLCADREAVDARGAVAGEPGDVDRAGIRLEGDLGVGLQREAAGDGVEERGDRRRREERRRAATDVDRLRGSAREVAGGGMKGELCEQRRRAVLLRGLARCLDVEVAVRADVPAVRHVDIERERLSRGHR